MKKVIVTTTINPPTKAIEGFQNLKDWDLVVIGDLKTTKDYHLDRGVYVTPEEQEKYDKPLSDAIGWNCIPRRSFGLLWAHDMGADIDAVCRMEHAPKCKFDPSFFPMASNKPSPFNSQNTFISGKWLKDYFLFPHVGRMDDIWASYYVEAKGAQVVYGKASVYQDRNVHNLVKDMQAEYGGYENNLELVQNLVADPESILQYLPGRSANAFRLYRKHFG